MSSVSRFTVLGGNDLIWENMSRLVIDADYLLLGDRVIKTGRTIVLGHSYLESNLRLSSWLSLGVEPEDGIYIERVSPW